MKIHRKGTKSGSTRERLCWKWHLGIFLKWWVRISQEWWTEGSSKQEKQHAKVMEVRSYKWCVSLFFKILIWTIFKVFIEFAATLLLLFMFCSFFWPWGMFDLSSPIRARTHTLCIGRWSLKLWTTREVLWCVSWDRKYFSLLAHLIWTGRGWILLACEFRIRQWGTVTYRQLLKEMPSPGKTKAKNQDSNVVHLTSKLEFGQ